MDRLWITGVKYAYYEVLSKKSTNIYLLGLVQKIFVVSKVKIHSTAWNYAQIQCKLWFEKLAAICKQSVT